MPRVFDGEVHTAYGQAYVMSGGELPWDLDMCFGGQHNGLCGAGTPGGLFLVTGLHTGAVPMAVDVDTVEPAVEDGWEDVVEVSFDPRGPEVMLQGWGGEHATDLTLPGGPYRVRYCATGMDPAHQQDTRLDGDPVLDRYLLQFWPAPTAPDTVVRQGSEQSAYWHRVARDAPAPPSPRERADAQLAQQARERVEALARQQRFEIDFYWGGRAPTPRLRELGAVCSSLARTDRDLLDELAALEPDTQHAAARWLARRAFEIAEIDTLEWARAGLAALDRGDRLPHPFTDLADAFALVAPAGGVTVGGTIAGGATAVAVAAAPGFVIPSLSPDSGPIVEDQDQAMSAAPSAPAPPPPGLHPPGPSPTPAVPATPVPAISPASRLDAPPHATSGHEAARLAHHVPVHRPSMAIPALPAATATDPLHALLDTFDHARAAFNERADDLTDELRARYLASP